MKTRCGWGLLAALAFVGCSDVAVQGHVMKPDDDIPVDSCGCNPEFEVCYDETCYDQRQCENPCPEGEICMNGACMLCTSKGQCFATGNEKVPGGGSTCTTNDDCKEGEKCVSGSCKSAGSQTCSPECKNDEVCYHGECRPASFLWSLCRASSECGNNSDCIFEIQPSTVLTYNGIRYGTEENINIPVSLLDSRINVDNYKSAHPGAAVSGDERIGICSRNCTQDAGQCPAGWTCMLALIGDAVYPEDAELPFADSLVTTTLEKSGYANICRPEITANTAKNYPLNPSFCSYNEGECQKNGGVFYDDMCLESCNPNGSNVCPFMFSCSVVEVNGNIQGVCVPNNGTCGACLDRDEDGVGYGLCDKPGIDCDDTDPDAYYGKKLLNDEDSCDRYDEEITDLNCNGIIDRFEMVGTTSNCMRCGQRCQMPDSPQSADQVDVSCIYANGDIPPEKWREQADANYTHPSFVCLTSCAFGYGDCAQDSNCSTRLLNDVALSTDDEDNTTLTLNPNYFNLSPNTGTVFVRDKDNDGFAALDVGETATNGQVILSPSNTVVCCSGAPHVCYSATADWKTTRASENDIAFTTRDELLDIMRFDANDNNPAIKPTADDVCDGIDNDGSTVMMTSTTGVYESCREYCDPQKNPGADCKDIENKNEGGTFDGTYRINSRCDRSPDGFGNPTKFVDVLHKEYIQGDKCSIYNSNNKVCNNGGKVVCKKASQLQFHCSTMDPGCECFRGCPCLSNPDNLTCKGTEKSPCVEMTQYDESTFTDCTQDNYDLTCIDLNPPDPNDDNPTPDDTFNNIDENCNGLIDEEAVVPCIIMTKNGNDTTFSNGAKCIKKGNNVECEYVMPINDVNAYELHTDAARELNADSSLNLCRLGKLVIDLDNPKPAVAGQEQEYYAKCMPMFQPREYDVRRENGSENAEYDFYGDGIDSNCDGFDYDLRNAVFVEMWGEGACDGKNTHGGRYLDNAACGFEHAPGILPVTSLDRAIEVAEIRIAPYQVIENSILTTKFHHLYDDILVRHIASTATQSASAINPSYRLLATKQTADARFPKDLQTETLPIPSVENPYMPPSRFSVPEDYQKPNKFHWYFIENRDLNANNYIYPGEFSEPDAQIRIWGGFEHTDDDFTTWINTEYQTEAVREVSNISSILYTAIANNSSFPMSLSLHNMKINFKPGQTVTYNINQLDPNRDLLNGVTFIGLNCGGAGCEKLVMDNTNITVTSPAGFSFTSGPSSNYHKNGNPNGTEIRQGYSNIWNSRGYDGYYIEGDVSYLEGNYDEFYKNNNCNNPPTCIDNTVPGGGGCGGWGSFDPFVCAVSTDLLNGNNISGKSGGRGAQAGGAGNVNKTMSTDNSDCGNSNLTYDGNHNGGDGPLGKQGAPGNYSNIPIPYLQGTDGFFYIATDTTKGGDGKNGSPGSGGGGGSCYAYTSYCPYYKDPGWFHAGCGGVGGCGGAGGKAGGTGGSAIGVLLRPPLNEVYNLTLRFERGSVVEVHPGNGGNGQQGQKGQDGMRKGTGLAHGAVGAFSACTLFLLAGSGGDGGAGGGGGPGSGGRAGTGFSFVISCPRTIGNPDSFKSNVAEAIKHNACGYKVPENFGNQLQGSHTAKCTAAANANTASYSPAFAQAAPGAGSGIENVANGLCVMFKPYYEKNP